jgi:hypothetical protein
MTWDVRKIKQQSFSETDQEALTETEPPENADSPMNSVAMLGFYDSDWGGSDDIPLHMQRQYHALGLWTPSDLRTIRRLMTRGIVPE